MEILFAAVLWIAFCFAVGVAAISRGRGGTAWFLVAFFLSPLIGLLLLIAFPRLQRDPAYDDQELMRNVRQGRRREPRF